MRIRPPETWAHPEVAEAFHARGWDVLREHWNRDPEHGPVGHCWQGMVRPVGDAGGDVVAPDLAEHGLEAVALGGGPASVGPIEVRADDRSLLACLPEVDVEPASRGLAAECAAFGEAIAVLSESIGEPPLRVALSMDASQLSIEVHWPPSSLRSDETVRRLAAVEFEAQVPNDPVGSLLDMRRLDDGWEVTVDLPPNGSGAVVLTATTALPRRPLCGPPPRPPANRTSSNGTARGG